MPTLVTLGTLRAPHLEASVVRCDGTDSPRESEEKSLRDRLWFVLHGRFEVRSRRFRNVADPATAVFIPGGVPFTVRHPDGCGDSCLSLGGSFVERELSGRSEVKTVSAGGFTRLRSLAGRLNRGERVEAAELEETACHALEAPPRSQADATPWERRLAESVHREIALRFDEPLALASLAAPLGVSVFTLCRAFRRATGTTVHRMRQRLRVRHATSLILDTRWSLARVAAECGLANHSHLTRLFRRELGVTPTAFRATWGDASA